MKNKKINDFNKDEDSLFMKIDVERFEFFFKKELAKLNLEERLLRLITWNLGFKNQDRAIEIIKEYGFIKQKEMYSEEDMLKSFMAGIKCESNNGQNFEQFIKQFKKTNKI
jgi:hypothetical protein